MHPKLRSFNSIFNDIVFYPGRRSSAKTIVNPQSCQAILDKLRLNDKYPNASKSLDIVDIFPGFGVFPTMLNYELKPKTHVLVESKVTTANHIQDLLEISNKVNSGRENFIRYAKDGYSWKTYKEMIEVDKIIQPKKQDDTGIHDELLIVANLLQPNGGESLFAQWIMCAAHKNWLHKYGRVRMICFLQEVTAQKFLSGPGFLKRNRSSVKRDIFTDTRLIAVTEMDGDNYKPDGFYYDPNLLLRDQPLVLPLDTVVPAPTRMAVVEVLPRPKKNVNIESLDYVSQILMYRGTKPLSEAINYISPGAGEGLSPKLVHILHKTPKQLTADEFAEVTAAFDLWPFKPSLEDRLFLNPTPEDNE